MTSRRRLRLATFNINGINSRLNNLVLWLRETAPDIVCLQEIKATSAAFPQAALQAEGYQAVWLGQKSWNGVAILSKGTAPILIRNALPGDEADNQARYIEAAVQGIVVCCIYAPNGNPISGPKFSYKLEWMARLHRHAKSLVKSEHPVAIAGDFNVVPTDADIYNPKSWRRNALLQPEARDAYAKLLKQGWTDSIRALHPDEPIYTFWDYFREHWPRNAGLRIDHLLLNATLAPRLTAAGVDADVRGQTRASDHAPAWIDLAKPATAKR